MLNHMKFAGFCLLTAVLLPSACALAQDADAAAPATADAPAVPDGPYASIVVRNMFALVPIPPAVPAEPVNVDPPPKLTPNGIMTIFGRDQCLFKATKKPQPGQQAKDDAYVLAEGERQDDIEVVKIDHLNSIITFNNHGTLQELPLVAAKDVGGPAAGPGGSRAGGMLPGAGGRQTPSFAGTRPSAQGGGNSVYGGGAGAYAGGVNQAQDASAPLTRDQTELLIETQRAAYQNQGNPLANLLPPTRGDAGEIVRQLGGSGPAP